MYRIAGSAMAWATSSRSKGSRWISGRSATAGRHSNDRQLEKADVARLFSDDFRPSHEIRARRSADLIAISQMLAALNRMSLAGSRIVARTGSLTRSGAEITHRRMWVSSRMRISTIFEQFPDLVLASVSKSSGTTICRAAGQGPPLLRRGQRTQPRERFSRFRDDYLLARRCVLDEPRQVSFRRMDVYVRMGRLLTG